MVPFFAVAQQDSQYTQYMYNTQTINPAYSGSKGVLSFNTLYRTQWVGFEGAPKTFTFAANSPIADRVGLGVSFFNDEIGVSKESNIALDFAYTIPLNDRKTFLSFGVKGGLNLLNVDFNLLNAINPNAPEFANNINNQLSPNIGAGIYLRQSSKWYIGVSVPSFLETDHYDDTATSLSKERMNFYLIGGYVFNITDHIKMKPAALLKAVDGAPLAVDGSINFLFNEKLTLGAAYRWDAAISGLFGFQLNNSIMLGYAYDYDTTEVGNYNSGSHEFFLRFELGTKQEKVTNPRFF